MTRSGLSSCLFGLVLIALPSSAETVVFLRHGEKPDAGLGQLDCRGLNRALALPRRLAALVPRADVIMAPDPAVKKSDRGREYDYVRPLATIEPTAVALGLPVTADIGYQDVAGLVAALRAPALAGKTVYVAWEHRQIVAAARALMTAAGGDARHVPDWASDDYNGMFVVSWPAADGRASFKRLSEGLDGRSEVCPGG